MTTAANQGGGQNNTGAAADGGNAGGANQGGGTALSPGQNQNGNNGNNGNGNNGQNGGAGSGNGADGGGTVQLYDAGKIKLPDGWTVNEGLMKDFLSIATKLKLSQEDAQGLVDLQVKGIQAFENQFKTKYAADYQKQQDEAYDKRQADYIKGLETDKTIGGPKLKENIEIAMRAISKFGDPELAQLFDHPDPQKNPNGLGLGNIPALVRVFYKIGKMISEDNSGGGDGGGNKQVSAAEKLFGAGSEVKAGAG